MRIKTFLVLNTLSIYFMHMSFLKKTRSG